MKHFHSQITLKMSHWNQNWYETLLLPNNTENESLKPELVWNIFTLNNTENESLIPELVWNIFTLK